MRICDASLCSISEDSFSGLPYHDRIYIDTLTTGETFELSYNIPGNAIAGAGQTDVIIYRGYDWENDDGTNFWSYGRIIFEGTVGYFCPPMVN